jgi:hypothetical protein
MTRADQPIPCQVGLRCPNPETCNHTFQHPDGSSNRLHADDWFAEPDRHDFPKGEAGSAAFEATRAAAAPITARAQWACKLDCPQNMRLKCLAEGLTEGPTLQYGVYGSYTASQRQQIVRERKEQAKKAREAQQE